MRTLFLFILLFRQFVALAQPVFITEDHNPNKTTDGYRQGYLVDSPKELNGVLYFSTPNFRLYQSDGTANGTKMLLQFPEGSLVYVKAVTKGFVYFTIRNSNGLNAMKRLNRLTFAQEWLTYYQKPLTLEAGYSKVFVNTSKDLIAIRMHNSEMRFTQLLTLADNGPAEAKVVTVSLKSDNSSLLNTFSDVAFMDKQVYYNGFEKKDDNGKKEFEYTIASAVPADKPGGEDYSLKNLYSLRSKGYELNDGFYTINDSLFTIGFFKNSTTNTRDFFVASLHPQTLRVPATLPTDQNFAWGEVLDNALYLINGTRLLHWVPYSNNIREVYRKRTYQYQRMQPDHSLLKCGNFIVFREEDSLRTYNLLTKEFKHVTMPERFTPPNSVYKMLDHYVWTTGKYIYHVTSTGLTSSFTQYDPVTKQSTPLLFPEFKGEQFDAFLTIFQTGGKFLFMTRYLGKKRVPVYRIFVM